MSTSVLIPQNFDYIFLSFCMVPLLSENRNLKPSLLDWHWFGVVVHSLTIFLIIFSTGSQNNNIVCKPPCEGQLSDGVQMAHVMHEKVSDRRVSLLSRADSYKSPRLRQPTPNSLSPPL